MKLSKDMLLEVRDGKLLVNGREFVLDDPKEEVMAIDGGKLITLFGGNQQNQWSLEEVEGHFKWKRSGDIPEKDGWKVTDHPNMVNGSL